MIQELSTDGRTLLFWAATDVDNGLEQLKKLLDNGAAIDSRDSKGCTALHWAVDAGAIKNVQYLLERGADTNIHNDKGKTPLLLAREKKWHAIADLFIEEQRTILENFCLKRDKT